MTDTPTLVAAPRWATPRNESRPTYGGEAAHIAKQLGVELMPWQRQVLDVGLEHHPESGRLHYREIVHSEPRQSGKSTLSLVRKVWRATRYAERFGAQSMVYSAQTGKAARKKLMTEWIPMLQGSDLAWVVADVRKAVGAEVLAFVSGSTLEPGSSSRSSGHGDILDEGDVDEAFSDQDDRREQSLLPAMLTRSDAQLWVCSTAGTAEAHYLRRKIDVGREWVESEDDSNVAFFEWSAPEGADADDEDVWWSCMPALGFTQSLAAVRHARRTMLDGEFRRAFLNQWTTTGEAAIPWSAYLKCRGDDVTPIGWLHVGVDCTPERSHSTIAVAASADAGVAVEIVTTRPGTNWVMDALRTLVRDHQVEKVLVQATGPMGTILPELEEEGISFSALTMTEMARSAAVFLDHITENTIGIRTNDEMDRAVEGAKQATQGDAFRWARRNTATNLSPLIAASMAAWSASNSSGGALWLHV